MSLQESIMHKLSKRTSFLGLKLWVAIIICLLIVLLLLLSIAVAFIFRRFRRNRTQIPPKIAGISRKPNSVFGNYSMDRRLLSRNRWDIEMGMETPEKQVVYPDYWSSNRKTGDGRSNAVNGDCSALELVGPYMLREIEEATNGFEYENVIGTGDYGVVYEGLLPDNTRVAVKKLYSNRSGNKAFMREAEEILLIRHRNLVKLQGYCAEGTYRILVYEYVDNGDLEQWLHQGISKVSPLTWNVRMQIIIGIAKGLTYLHEDSEPPFVHGNLKSSNILLDQQWNPKISDIGIKKLLGPEWNHATARPIGMSGYLAPEYESSRGASEKSDVYSFGMLILEIVSGKMAIESTVNEIEEYLVDWIKSMVEEENYKAIVDQKLPQLPTLKELKRILLIALRCVDLEFENRPKMGEIIHMLEPRDLLLSDENVVTGQVSRRSSAREDQLS